MFLRCSLCQKEALDSADFESGNNAEIPITIDLCGDHLKEYEEMGYAFEEKYGAQFLEVAYGKIGF